MLKRKNEERVVSVGAAWNYPETIIAVDERGRDSAELDAYPKIEKAETRWENGSVAGHFKS